MIADMRYFLLILSCMQRKLGPPLNFWFSPRGYGLGSPNPDGFRDTGACALSPGMAQIETTDASNTGLAEVLGATQI